MPGLSWTKRHVASVVEVLDQDYVDIEGAATAALNAALSIIEERGKFAVVGQVYKTPEHGDLDPSDEAAVKVCLGLFESDTKANEAATQLTANAAGDLLRTWVVPTFYGTAAGWHKERRDYYAGLEAKANEKRREKMRVSIEKQTELMVSRATEIRTMEEKADGQNWPCPANRVKQKGCRHEPQCK